MRFFPRAAPALALAVLAACAGVVNYPDARSPRYGGAYGEPRLPHIKVVTFNVKFGERLDQAVALLSTDARVADADILALQEMDAAGVDRIARDLRLNYVYYPATRHPRTGRDFGNALLSPWPIREDRKLVLPGFARFTRIARIAVAATVEVRGLPVRAYSVHLESPAGTSGNGRRRQLEALLADIEPHRRHVVVAGDFNNTGIAAEAFSAAGFDWVTQHVGRTIALFSWDHIFVRGLPLLDAGSAGAVADNRDSSDHRPVWARLAVPADPQAGASSR